MRDDFDLHEYNNTLRSKLQLEQELTGLDASTKTIAFLRKSIYPKLSDQELDKFIIQLADHLDLEVPSYRLGEVDLDQDVLPRQLTISLDELTYDIIEKMFDGEVNLPNPDDSSRQVSDAQDLEQWSLEIKSKYGNINLRLDSESAAPWEKVKVLDDDFINDRDRYIDGKAQALKDYSSKD